MQHSDSGNNVLMTKPEDSVEVKRPESGMGFFRSYMQAFEIMKVGGFFLDMPMSEKAKVASKVIRVAGGKPALTSESPERSYFYAIHQIYMIKMSGWDSYASSVKDLSPPGECVGAGIYGNDGSKWASTDGINIQPDEIRKAREWIDNKETSDYTHGITLDGNPYTFLRHLEDNAGTMTLKRKPKAGETLNDRLMYQAFVAASKTAVMVAIFLGGKRGNEAAGAKRMSDLIEYLKGQNM